MIALIDYGAGNLASVRKALAALDADVKTPAVAAELVEARGIIVPGVGHFAATQALDDRWRVAIQAALDGGAALFGICLGMQWLFEGSIEAPGMRGFCAFSGACSHLAEEGAQNPKTDPTPGPRFRMLGGTGWRCRGRQRADGGRLRTRRRCISRTPTSPR